MILPLKMGIPEIHDALYHQELDRCVARRFLVDNGSAKSLELR
jgi:hypothetical protein